MFARQGVHTTQELEVLTTLPALCISRGTELRPDVHGNAYVITHWIVHEVSIVACQTVCQPCINWCVSSRVICTAGCDCSLQMVLISHFVCPSTDYTRKGATP